MGGVPLPLQDQGGFQTTPSASLPSWIHTDDQATGSCISSFVFWKPNMVAVNFPLTHCRKWLGKGTVIFHFPSQSMESEFVAKKCCTADFLLLLVKMKPNPCFHWLSTVFDIFFGQVFRASQAYNRGTGFFLEFFDLLICTSILFWGLHVGG